MSCADHFARWHSHWDQKLVLHVFRPIRTEFLLHLKATAKKISRKRGTNERSYHASRGKDAVRINWIRRAFVHIYYAYLCIRRCQYVGGTWYLLAMLMIAPIFRLKCEIDFEESGYIWNVDPYFRHLRVSLKHFVDKTPKFLVKSLRWMSEKKCFINTKWIIADVSTAAKANNFRNSIEMRDAFTFIYFCHIFS